MYVWIGFLFPLSTMENWRVVLLRNSNYGGGGVSRHDNTILVVLFCARTGFVELCLL